MKRITALAFLIAALISIGSTRARAQEVNFVIPFSFAVQNRVLPAGIYAVSHAAPKVILIESTDGRFRAMTTIFSDDRNSDGTARLIFAKYSNQYFLHEVLSNELNMNVALPASRLEKRVRVEEAQLAHSQTVAVLHVGER